MTPHHYWILNSIHHLWLQWEVPFCLQLVSTVSSALDPFLLKLTLWSLCYCFKVLWRSFRVVHSTDALRTTRSRDCTHWWNQKCWYVCCLYPTQLIPCPNSANDRAAKLVISRTSHQVRSPDSRLRLLNLCFPEPPLIWTFTFLSKKNLATSDKHERLWIELVSGLIASTLTDPRVLSMANHLSSTMLTMWRTTRQNGTRPLHSTSNTLISISVHTTRS